MVIAGCSSGSMVATDNGVSKLSGKEILAQASTNAQQQTSVHIHGTGQCPQGAFTTDMKLNKDGSGTGTISFPPYSLQVVSTAQGLYVKGSKLFWTKDASAKIANQIGNRWVLSTSKTANTCLQALGNYSAIMANFLKVAGTATKSGSGAVSGIQAITLNLPTATVWVSTTGVALPVRVDSTATTDGMSFYDWNLPVTVTVPAASDVINASVIK
jgi:hypothetical protein